MKKKSLTIGIPAYNEESNISYLLSEILSQKNRNFVLKEIIIASDGSSDKTIEKVKELNSKKITIIEGKKRKGATYRQNQIIDRTNTDVLVLLDADISLEGDKFLDEIIKPFYSQKADLVSTRLLTMSAKNYLEKILAVSHEFKNSVFENYKKGKNIYTCHGAARAFSKNLYKNFKFLNNAGEDAYSYLFAKKNGYKYVYTRKAICYIRVPSTIGDHKKQSVRFFNSIKFFEKEFGEKRVADEYSLDKKLAAKMLFASFVNYPIETLLYIPVVGVMKLHSKVIKYEDNSTWNISRSSKTLH